MFWKKSLKIKLSLILISMVLIILFLSIFLCSAFSTKYYLYDKKQSLIEVFEAIDALYVSELEIESETETDSTTQTDASGSFDNKFMDYPQALDSSISDELSLILDQFSQNRNMSIIIYRDMYPTFNALVLQSSSKLLLYSSLGSNQGSQVESNNIYTDYSNSFSGSSGDSISNERYTINVVDVKRLGSSYIYLDGNFSNGDHILIRASVAGITESVNLSIRFFVYVSVAAAAVGFVIMMFVSNRFLMPITVLTGIARRMSELDFTAKYQVKSQDEVGELGHSMNMLSEKLEQALTDLKAANVELVKDLEKKEQIDSMRKEFLANVSHELKTPIALIQGYAEGLVDNISDDEESRAFYCDVIMDEAKKMNHLVKKLMDLNQLEFGYNTVNMENFDVVDLIRAIIAKSDILQKQKEATIVFECLGPLFVWSDAYMTEEVFTNYFTNAFNHLDGERIIEITVKKIGDKVRVSVFNTGEPIPESDIANIWDKFYKVDKARTREYGGSGVGLSFVKASMEQLGQAYGVENKKNGVKFWFELPMK